MKYRKRLTEIEAVQWMKMGDHPAVVLRGPFVFFDRGGKYFYIDHTDPDTPRPRFWLAVNPEGSVAQQVGSILEFAFYEVKGGERVPASEHPDLVEAYAKAAGWGGSRPRETGLLPLDPEGRDHKHVVPGDWIITAADGTLSVMGPAEFLAECEPVEGQ